MNYWRDYCKDDDDDIETAINDGSNDETVKQRSSKCDICKEQAKKNLKNGVKDFLSYHVDVKPDDVCVNTLASI